MIILFPKRLFHNHAPSLLDLLSYWSEISCESTGEPADRALSPRALMEPGMQLLSAVLPGFSAKTLGPRSAEERAAQSTGSFSPWLNQSIRRCLP